MTAISVPIFEYKELYQQAQKAVELEEINNGLKQEIQFLRELLRLERIKKYGGKSESLSDEQLSLLDTEPSVEAAEIEKEAQLPKEQKTVARAKHPGRNELPAHLPRKEEIRKVEERKCPCCGGERRVIGYEEKEELDLEPAKYFVRVVKREKLACLKCPEAGVVSAPVSSNQIVEKSKLGSAMIVDILIKKYAEHQPLYRQQATLERDYGIQISRSTLCEAVMAAGELLRPIKDAMKEDLLKGNYIQADETPIGVQSKEKVGRNHTAFAFQYSRPGGPVIFDFQMSRARQGPKKFLANYCGILQSDGYEGYEKIGSPQIIRAGCMAHVRRKFIDVLKIDPKDKEALEVVEIIAKLYHKESEAREAKLDIKKRRELRQAQSLPLMEKLREKLLEISQKALPSSGLAKATNYALSQWKKLTTFLEHGVVEIDQNLCENGMRPLALGRKNWLHIGSEKAGSKIAHILSVFETCKRLKINIRNYLLDVLPRLGNYSSTNVSDLTPLHCSPSSR
jgi:transposase